jgi:hypothetical protein
MDIHSVQYWGYRCDGEARSEVKTRQDKTSGEGGKEHDAFSYLFVIPQSTVSITCNHCDDIHTGA